MRNLKVRQARILRNKAERLHLADKSDQNKHQQISRKPKNQLCHNLKKCWVLTLTLNHFGTMLNPNARLECA